MSSKKPGLKALRPDSWEEEYDRRSADYDALCREAVFTLETAYADAGIKIHVVEGRVKSVESIRLKAADKQIEKPLEV